MQVAQPTGNFTGTYEVDRFGIQWQAVCPALPTGYLLPTLDWLLCTTVTLGWA